MKKKTWYKIKIVLLLILWCFCTDFMKTSVNFFVSEPSLTRFACAVPLVYASFKCILEIVRNASLIKILDYSEEKKDA